MDCRYLRASDIAFNKRACRVVEKMRNQVPDVIALTLLDASSFVEKKIASETKVWVCVRNQEVNRTHPDIVSVPTQRIPPALAEGLLTDNHSNGYFGDTELFVGSLISNEKLGGHTPTIYAVESLLSGKLGVS